MIPDAAPLLHWSADLSRVSSEPPVGSEPAPVSKAVSSKPAKTDRVAYMRDLMRRKRQAKRRASA
jgi:hypothetical protein